MDSRSGTTQRCNRFLSLPERGSIVNFEILKEFLEART